MSVLEFIQLVIRNKKWVLYFPFIVGVCVGLLTFNMPNTYTSDMTIYTGIASGFNPDNDFENKIDFHAVNSRFDNLINIIGSREIRTSVSIKLLAFMVDNPDRLTALLDNCKNSTLNHTLTDSFVVKYRREDISQTEALLRAQLDTSNKENDLYLLVFGKKLTPFNIKTLEDIKAERQGFSDMLKIEYSCEDPFTCKKTLDLTTSLFLEKYQGMRIGEANQAVSYFKEQTSLSRDKLHVCEESLKQFRSSNRVINYYEQTKYIADQNEDIEKNISQLQMELEGYVNALQKVEDKIGKRFLIKLQSEKIVKTRDSLSQELTKNGLNAVKNGTQFNTSGEIEGLKKQLKESVDNLYSLNNTTEGMPGKKLLEEWLTLTVSKEETESKLRVLLENKTKFDQVFDRYAPMGSELNKLEREVETAEKEYLNLLHSLNQAILRERNLEVSETVEVIDEADMPIVPNPSKRILLIVASILCCIVIVVVMLIIRQYLDNSLGSILRMEKILGMSGATAFMNRNVKNLLPDGLDVMDHRSMERWYTSLNGSMGSSGNNTALIVMPFNCVVEELKYYVDKMTAFLQIKGYNVKFAQAGEYAENKDGNCFVLTEQRFPELLPKALLADAKVIFFFFDAALKIDEYQLQEIGNWKKTGIAARGVLLNTSEQHISSYLGEIPRKRSKFRAFIKKQIMRYAG